MRGKTLYPVSKEVVEKFAHKLKEFRIQNNYTQEYCASIMGLSTQQYRRMETGYYHPSLFPMARLAKELGIELEYFVDHIETIQDQTERLWKEHKMSLNADNKLCDFDTKERMKILKKFKLWK